MPDMKTLTINGVQYNIVDPNAKPADWMPTIAEIGAAPAGYVDERGQYTDYTSALAQIKSVYASMGDRTKRCLFVDIINLDSTNFPRGSYFVEIYREWENYGTIVFTSSAYIKIVIRIAGSWGDFCYENPPMVVGTEYRTTERYNGKAVYAKAINFGTLPNKTTSYIESAITVDCTYVVSLTGTRFTGASARPLGEMQSAGWCTFYINQYGNLFVETDWDMSGSTAIIIAKYTKD